MNVTGRGYSPNAFTVRQGIPVKWVITSDGSYSCANYLVSPKLGVRQALQSGENVITFTPTEAGRIPFSCSMGMYRGAFTVVEKQGGGS
jgi:plastocyanin domain-containing protein